MADAPEAAVAPEAKTEATPNTNPEPQAPEQKPEAPDMHGFTSEQLAEMKKFYDANGGFDKVKAKISNPEPKPAEPVPEPKTPEVSATVQSTQPQPAPKGVVTQGAIMEKYYFDRLAQKPEFAPIAEDIESGAVLKEMDNLGIPFRYQDGSLDDEKIKGYLTIKAQTVPAKPTEAEPNASTAPTVDYVQVGDKIESLEQAQAVFMQAGHPKREEAKEFIRQHLNPNSPAPEAKK